MNVECQVEKNPHLRHVLLYEYHQGINATQAAQNINALYGDGFVAERTARHWFNKFKNLNFDLDDAPRSGRPSEFDDDRLVELLEEDNHQTTRELAEQLGFSQTAIVEHLAKLGYT